MVQTVCACAFNEFHFIQIDFARPHSKVAAKDCEIVRVSANELSRDSFQRQFVDKNIPVIITDLHLWNDTDSKSDIDGIDGHLDDDYSLKNVFVTTNHHRRFLYFDKEGQQQDADHKPTQIRAKMTWKEFKQRISPHDPIDNELDPYLEEKESFYLYGEPLPHSLSAQINVPSFLPLESNGDVAERADDCLIWISSKRTCSPLHFDLCQGFLSQLNGTKRVSLFQFNREKYQSFYPFPCDSKHRRQSMIDDIHRPDSKTFPLFMEDKEIRCHQGIIQRDEGLYIPFSWWHQIESDEQSGSISLSFRWNPYLSAMKEAMLTSSKMDNEMVGDIIFNECISGMPHYVQKVAGIWRSIFKSKQNQTVEIVNVEDESVNDEEQDEESCSSIDLLDVD